MQPAKPIVTIRRPEKDYFGTKWVAEAANDFSKILNDAVAEEVRRLVEDGDCSLDIPRLPGDRDFKYPEEWSVCFSCGDENAPMAWWSLRDVLKTMDLDDAPQAARAELRAMLVDAIAALDGAKPYVDRDF